MDWPRTAFRRHPLDESLLVSTPVTRWSMEWLVNQAVTNSARTETHTDRQSIGLAFMSKHQSTPCSAIAQPAIILLSRSYHMFPLEVGDDDSERVTWFSRLSVSLNIRYATDGSCNSQDGKSGWRTAGWLAGLSDDASRHLMVSIVVSPLIQCQKNASLTSWPQLPSQHDE